VGSEKAHFFPLGRWGGTFFFVLGIGTSELTTTSLRIKPIDMLVATYMLVHKNKRW